jgi:hypothetical protein
VFARLAGLLAVQEREGGTGSLLPAVQSGTQDLLGDGLQHAMSAKILSKAS